MGWGAGEADGRYLMSESECTSENSITIMELIFGYPPHLRVFASKQPDRTLVAAIVVAAVVVVVVIWAH